ncbi:MAG TPA: class I SAM-dependent RNA methyltransferase [Candidatus Competibacteraceae bacterium]|nr:class I SAM-dependent RNA methyltransferase [Candidatus Competibacteraceae bacterium]
MLLREGCEPRCRGCAHRLLDAAASAAQKQEWLARRLAPWAQRLAPLCAVRGEERWGYRDKVALSAQWSAQAGWRFGLWVGRELVAIPHCPVHSPRVRAMVALLMAALPPADEFPLRFYVQAGAQATLVLKSACEPNAGWLDAAAQAALAAAGIEGLWLNLHPAAGRRLFAKRGWRLLWGQSRSRDDQGLVYEPGAFQQLIPALYRQSVDEAEAFLAPRPGDAVVDLYCGSGATLVRWQARGACAVGVELGGAALECARLNAPEAELLRGACAQRLPQLRAWAQGQAVDLRLLYLNPPRTGVEPEVLAWVCQEYRPIRLAYLSCSAGTLARDLRRLCAAGYEVERITPYDFFPQTYHVETLALLRRG